MRWTAIGWLGLAGAAPALVTARAAPDAPSVWTQRAPVRLSGVPLAPFAVAVPSVPGDSGLDPGPVREAAVGRMVAAGLSALGASDPDARFVLGVEVLRWYTAVIEGAGGGAVDLRWQLLDRRTSAVIYAVETRGFAVDPAPASRIASATDNLLARDAFLAALFPLPAAGEPIERCPVAPSPLPDAPGPVLAATIGVEGVGGRGAGVIISASGHAWTAAALAGPPGSAVQVTLRSGAVVGAVVAASAPVWDVAVLDLPGAGFPCLPVREIPTVPQRVYRALAPGVPGALAPGGLRGRHERAGEGAVWLTDAPADPTGPGGPLLDGEGWVVGVTTERAGEPSFAGVTRAVPSDAALSALGIAWGAPIAAAPPPTGMDAPDPPLPASGSGICVFRTWNGPAYTFWLNEQELLLADNEYRCVGVLPGRHRLKHPVGFPLAVAVSEGETVFVRVSGQMGMTLSNRATFERIRDRGLSRAP